MAHARRGYSKSFAESIRWHIRIIGPWRVFRDGLRAVFCCSRGVGRVAIIGMECKEDLGRCPEDLGRCPEDLGRCPRLSCLALSGRGQGWFEIGDLGQRPRLPNLPEYLKMRYLNTLLVAVLCTCALQAAEPTQRFGIFYNPDLYPQKTPKETLDSVIGAIERDRIEYLVAHLLDPALVTERMNAMTTYYERVAAQQISSTGAGMNLRGNDLQNRVSERGIDLNFRGLATSIRAKLNDEPTNLKEMKLLLSDGQFQEGGDTARVTHKAFKDKALYFKKVGDRWFMENRKEEAAPPKE
jgi:hypothetical protein